MVVVGIRPTTAVLFLGVLGACGSPTRPDPRIAQPIGSPDRLAVIQWKFGPLVTTARVEARWGFLYATSKEVTSEALWQSSDVSVMRVTRSGELQSVAPGDATLHISYRDVSITHLMRVFPGEPPVLVMTPETVTYMSSTIRDSTRPDDRGIEGVLVEIISGHNAGRTSITDQYGSFYFYPPYVCGPMTMRLTKQGYREKVISFAACEWGSPDFSLTPLRNAIR